MSTHRVHHAARGARAVFLVLALVPALVRAQAPAELTDDTLACLTRELTAAGFTAREIDDLFTGRIADPEAFVKGQIGEEGIRAIARTCFPDASGTPPAAGSPPPDGGAPALSPEQRVCVAQYIDADLLDRMLRGEVRPEDVLAPERLEEIGRACFAQPTPGPHAVPVPPSIDLPPGVLECLKREVGEQAVAEVTSGQRQPTPEEYEQGSVCFPSPPPGAGDVEDPAVEACVDRILGPELHARVKRATVPPEQLVSPDQLQRLHAECFSDTARGGGPAGPPQEILACVEGVLGKARVEAFLRGGAQPTPDEMRQVEAAGCFPTRGAGQGGGPGPVPELPPGVRACLEGLFGAGRAAELLTGRAQPTPEELQRAQSCFTDGAPGPTGPPGSSEQCVQQCLQYGNRPEQECRDRCAGRTVPPPASCVDECVRYRAPDGTTHTREQCTQLCTGQPPPGPTGTPPPTGEPPGGSEQCVQQCTAYEGGRYNVGDYCERACRGEPVQPPSEPTPHPTSEPPSPPPEPTASPTPDTAQCVAGCTGYTRTNPDGTTHTYTADECQHICSGGSVQGAAAERTGPWWVRAVLRVLGY